MKKFWTNEEGGAALYAALVTALAMGTGALAVDFGRMSVLRTQLQDRADAGALGGATQLDGKDGSRTRATTMAKNAILQNSRLASNGAALDVQAVNFYSTITPNKVAATNDTDANYIEVVMNTKNAKFFLEPLASIVSGGQASTSGSLDADAIAQPNPYICAAPPLMICDPSELNAAYDLSNPANIGRQMRLKEPQGGNGAAAPGNFGLLALPDGSAGAADISQALAAVEPNDCYSLDVSTATGSKTNQVKSGINARFYGNTQAPNIVNYNHDTDLDSDANLIMGSGSWNASAYWSEHHGGASLPAVLVGASRYQVYLYEQGLTYAANGKQALYPAPASLPAGYTLVTPPGVNMPVSATPNDDSDDDGKDDHLDPDDDGVPDGAVASNGHERRLVKVAVLKCIEENVKGSHTYPTHGNFVEMLITQEVRDPPNAAIWAELVKPLTPSNDPDYHSNVRLVQ